MYSIPNLGLVQSCIENSSSLGQDSTNLMQHVTVRPSSPNTQSNLSLATIQRRGDMVSLTVISCYSVTLSPTLGSLSMLAVVCLGSDAPIRHSETHVFPSYIISLQRTSELQCVRAL